MLGSANTNLPLLTLTSWVNWKNPAPFYNIWKCDNCRLAISGKFQFQLSIRPMWVSQALCKSTSWSSLWSSCSRCFAPPHRSWVYFVIVFYYFQSASHLWQGRSPHTRRWQRENLLAFAGKRGGKQITGHRLRMIYTSRWSQWLCIVINDHQWWWALNSCLILINHINQMIPWTKNPQCRWRERVTDMRGGWGNWMNINWRWPKYAEHNSILLRIIQIYPILTVHQEIWAVPMAKHYM